MTDFWVREAGKSQATITSIIVAWDPPPALAANAWALRSDLREFSPSSKQWTWASGSSAVATGPGGLCLAWVYGTEGTAAAGDVPGARNDAVSRIDTSGYLWLFGGMGFDAGGTAGSLNDLWAYNVWGKMGTWQSGSNSVGPPSSGTGGRSRAYRTMGTAAAANVPGGRARAGVAAWNSADVPGRVAAAQWLRNSFMLDQLRTRG